MSTVLSLYLKKYYVILSMCVCKCVVFETFIFMREKRGSEWDIYVLMHIFECVCVFMWMLFLWNRSASSSSLSYSVMSIGFHSLYCCCCSSGGGGDGGCCCVCFLFFFYKCYAIFVRPFLFVMLLHVCISISLCHFHSFSNNLKSLVMIFLFSLRTLFKTNINLLKIPALEPLIRPSLGSLNMLQHFPKHVRFVDHGEV